jgi:hypothetical protein
MAKTYVVVFGSGNPASYTGLSPTMTVFQNYIAGASTPGWTLATGPTLSEIASGTGLYSFQYNPLTPYAFVCDGGAALLSTDRYVKGVLDPIQAVDERVGFSTDSFGSTAIDPASMYGYLKRALEFMEGNSSFDKTSGVWTIYSRGSSTLLTTKTLTNSSGNVTKV